MSLFKRRNRGQVGKDKQTDSGKFLDSLRNKTQLKITNNCTKRWTVRGEYLYFIDDYTIVVYSIAQRRVKRELEHEDIVYDFAFVGDNFLVSAGKDFVRLWKFSNGAWLTSKHFNNEDKNGYVRVCGTGVSPTSFLYSTNDTIRRLDITTPHSTSVKIEEVNTKTVNSKYTWSWLSEICGGKIALVLEIEKTLNIFDVVTFEVTAQLNLSPYLTEGFQLGEYRRFDVSFPDRVVLCVGDSAHSKLKFLILDPFDLNLRNSFILPNPIHSTLAHNSKLDDDGYIYIDANKSHVRMQYNCDGYCQILEISIEEEKITSSYGFHIEKLISPNCKSLCDRVIVADMDGDLKLESWNSLQNEILTSSYKIRGPIEHWYQECFQLGKRASRFCEQLSQNSFNGSLLEFFCGHRLLMTAIQDGDIRRSPHHKGVHLKWHEAIYSASRNVRLQTARDKKELTLILMEAARYRVIESASQYLLANDVMSEIRVQNEKIVNMGKQLFVRLVQLETAHVNLDLAFQRYKDYQGITELMGIALNVIPFLGGSIAAAVTAGADLVEGIQISEVISESLEVSVDTITSSPSFETGVLKCIDNSLRKEEIKKKVELLIALDKCGVTIDQLQDILNDGIKRNEYTEYQNNKESKSDGELTTEWSAVETKLVDSRGNKIVSQASASSNRTEMSSNSQISSLSNLEHWKLSEFRHLSKKRDIVSLLSIQQCSFFVAALMLQFDDDLEDEFRKLQPLLYGINISKMISGKVLCDYKRNSEEVNGLLTDLKKKYAVKNIMIEEFTAFVQEQGDYGRNNNFLNLIFNLKLFG